MKSYYKQLVEGCGDPMCGHPLCVGSLGETADLNHEKLSDLSAKTLASQLNVMSHNYFCNNVNVSIISNVRPEDKYSNSNGSEYTNEVNKRPYPVIITSASTKEGHVVHRFKEVGTPDVSGSFYELCSGYAGMYNNKGSNREVSLFTCQNVRDGSKDTASTNVPKTSTLKNPVEFIKSIRSYIDIQASNTRDLQFKTEFMSKSCNGLLKEPLLESQSDAEVYTKAGSPVSVAIKKIPFEYKSGGSNMCTKNDVSSSNASISVQAPNLFNSNKPKYDEPTIIRFEKYFGLPFFTLGLIKALVRTSFSDSNKPAYFFESESDRNFLSRSVQFVFSSSLLICFSFLADSSNINIHEAPGIDFEELSSTYEILNNIDPANAFRDKIVQLCEQLLIEDIVKLDKIRGCNERYMRKYIVILENDYIFRCSKSLRFTRFISRILASLNRHNKKILIMWFSNLNNEQLSNYVNIFNNCITSDFQVNSRDPTISIKDAIKVMSMLFTSNKLRCKKGKGGIPISKFYNITVSNHLDYKKQYDQFSFDRPANVTSEEFDIISNAIICKNVLGMEFAASKGGLRAGDSIVDTDTNSNSSFDGKKTPEIPLYNGPSQSTMSTIKKSRREGAKNKNKLVPIFKYTFLLNPVGKTRLLRVDAVFKMLRKYGSAFVNIEIVNRTCRLFENQLFYVGAPLEFSNEITPFLILEVRRDNIINDTINQLFAKRDSFLKPLKVKFVDSGEEGVDQGGLQKEFIQIVVDKFMDPIYGMFSYDEKTRLCWIRGDSKENVSSFEAFGIVQALALYNGAILRLNFPTTMYKKLLVENDATLEDLKMVDPVMGKSLEELLEYDGDDFEDVFMLNFTFSYDDMGTTKTVQLVKNGQNIQVSKDKREQYVSLVVDYVLNKKCKRQFEAYKKGYYEVLDIDLLMMASSEELEMMTCGSEPQCIEFIELKMNTTYNNGYTENSPIIKWFWKLLIEEFTLRQKLDFLTFCTASDRMPLGGFSRLKFTITKNGPNTNRLPTAMTCFSILMLPEYDSIDKLRTLLLAAIQCSNSFGLA